MRKSVFPFIPFLLLVIPILEIGVFILIGGQIGVGYTLLGIVLTAIIGSFLLRSQGLALLGQVQSQFEQGKVPGKALAHGVMLLVAGLLLLTPGFVTDSLGFLLFVPPIRDAIWAFVSSRVTTTSFGAQASGFTSARDGHFYREYHSQSYSETASSTHPRDPSIIDLDEEDFNEVGDLKELSDQERETRAKNSPWNDEK